jgi:HEAT repeat protein
LIDGTAGRARLSVVRASAAHPSAAVTTSLLALLDGDDRELAAAAAVSLGVPHNEPAVAPLAGAIARGEPALRMAAIRGLGRINTPSARRSLEVTAAFHPDPATRRRANAEVVVLTRHDGQSR